VSTTELVKAGCVNLINLSLLIKTFKSTEIVLIAKLKSAGEDKKPDVAGVWFAEGNL
jgi:hypothetical protein